MTDRPSTDRGAACALLLLCLALSPTFAEQAAPPSAESLLDAYVEATGGREAYQKVTNRVTHSKMSIPDQGIEIALTVYAARPNRTYTLIESDATGKIERGTDGEVVWENSALRGPLLIEGAERVDSLRDATFDRWSGWRDLYASIEYAGSEKIGDDVAHKVVVHPQVGHEQTFWFDDATHLLVRVDMDVENPMGTFPVTSRLGDYRQVGDLRVPHRVTVEILGTERVVTTEKVEQNVDLPEDRFDLPAEIRALVEEAAEAGAGGS